MATKRKKIMKTLLKIFLIVGISSQLFSCNDCIECKDEKAVLNSNQGIENADLMIDSLTILSVANAETFIFRTKVSYKNDDCAENPKLILLLPSNIDSININEIYSIRTSNDSLIQCTHPKNGCIECTLGKEICPESKENPVPQYFWVDVSMKSKVKNISAFVYSQTADMVQCNNFKHLAVK